MFQYVYVNVFYAPEWLDCSVYKSFMIRQMSYFWNQPGCSLLNLLIKLNQYPCSKTEDD